MSESKATIIIGVALIVLITAGLTYLVVRPGNAPGNGTNMTGTGPTITVRGDATETVTPDLLTIGISVESVGDTAADSQSRNAADAAKLTSALKALGLEDSELQTSSYSTYEVYDPSCYDCYPYYYEGTAAMPAASLQEAPAGSGSGVSSSGVVTPDYYPQPVPPRPYPCKTGCNVTGYKTVHVLMVKTNRTSDGGTIIDAAINATNASSVQYIYFSISDTKRIETESSLQASAAQSARSKAGNIAVGLGASLGKIVSVNPDYYYPYPVFAYDRSTAETVAPAVPTEIFPTDTTMSASVTVVYELVQ
jgi:uncharacterized protein YggE